MGMPVNRLKLMAFAFGAVGRRADRDVRDGAQRERVPRELRVPAPDHRLHDGDPRRRGEPGGVVLGAVLVSVLLEVLRDAGGDVARPVLRRDHPRSRRLLPARRRSSPSCSAARSSSAVVARVVAGGIDARWTAGPVDGSGRVAGWAADWVIVPDPARRVGRARSRTSALVALALALTLVHGWTRIALLVPTLYLAAFVWENVLLPQPGVDALHRPRRDPRRR